MPHLNLRANVHRMSRSQAWRIREVIALLLVLLGLFLFVAPETLLLGARVLVR
jgi:hypothetical protein